MGVGHGHSTTSGAARLRRKLWRTGKPMVCHWCGKLLRLEVASVEHVEPKLDGGKRSDISNLAWACLECNRERGRLNWIRHKKARTER
jgi:RNase P subunit RPR2